MARLMPYARPGEVGAASFAGGEGTVDPVAVAETLVLKARELTAEVIYPCETKSIRTLSGRVRGVGTSAGMIEADTVVLVAGNETEKLKVLFNVAVGRHQNAVEKPSLGQLNLKNH